MDKRSLKKVVMCTVLFICFGLKGMALAEEAKPAGHGDAIRIEIPVSLQRANVVFNMDHLAFSGDMPVGIKYMHLLANRFKEMGIKGQIIGIFHGDAAYMTLNDKAYNVFRSIKTGTPYKSLIAGLIEQGVQIEECAVSMKAHQWTNEDLLPAVKVNAGAVSRLIELM